MQFIVEKKQAVTFLALMLIMALLAMAPVWTQAAGGTPESPSGAQAAVGTGFTYQGRLDKSGSPFTGTCSFQFSLYDAASGGTQIGSTLTRTGVAVSGGLFTTELDFGTSAFPVDARYLQIAVKCGSESAYTTLSGRVALTAAPYALNLRPGAIVYGSDAANPVLGAVNSDTSGTGAGVYGEARSSFGAGVSGWNTASGGIAVYGRASGTTGPSRGVLGISDSSTGAGVRGETVDGHGLEGIVDWTQSGTGTGLYASGGFFGQAANFDNAAPGIATVSIQNAAGSTKPALVVTGTTHLEGALTWQPLTSTITIMPIDFRPESNTVPYTLGGYSLYTTAAGGARFFASLPLPNGATVTQVTFYWSDLSTSDATLTLYRDNPTGIMNTMTTLYTTGNTSHSSSTSTSISYAVVDNSQYGYYFDLFLPDSSIDVYEIFVEYTIEQPY